MHRPRGRAWKFGANVNTDVIIPTGYAHVPGGLGKNCLRGIDPQFSEKIAAGDIIVAGPNFGCGSSREEAPVAIKEAGISAVVAASFARIFYRNAINIGLPILESQEASQGIEEGDEIEIDLDAGIIHDLSKEKAFQSASFPEFMQRIIDRGGLARYIEERLAQRAPNRGVTA